MTANMKAPVVINAANRVGRQIVLRSNVYAINTPVFPAINENVHSQAEESLIQPEAASS
jgi:flagellar assembly factor FliW